MCGRIAITDNEDFTELFRSLGISMISAREPRYNVAPTAMLDVVRLEDGPALVPMRWGFTVTIRGRTRPVFNTRSDKAWSSPLWRGAIAKARVLVPVSGFYEWRRVNGKTGQAYYITPSEGTSMWFAGIHRGEEVSIITTDANEAMSAIHHRMPVTLSANEAMSWLQEDERETLEALMVPAAEDALTFTAVSDHVNNARHAGPACIEPVATDGGTD